MIESDNEIEQDRSLWEKEYAAGAWDCLKDKRELPRYGVLSAYVQYQGKPVSLLDVGCGEGMILKHCQRQLISKYCGVDISQVALNNIADVRPDDELVCASVEKFSTNYQYDIILLNEILYYTNDPVKYLKKYSSFLAPGGAMVISMHKKSPFYSYNNRCIWQVWRFMRKSCWNILDEVLISNALTRVSWKIALVQPVGN